MRTKNPTIFQIQLGQKLKKAREELGVSKSELGRRLGVYKKEVALYEEGTRRISVYRMQELARALEKSMLYFYTENKDLMTDIIQKWNYDKGVSYTNIPLVEEIYPDNLLDTMYTSKTTVSVPFNAIKLYDSIIAIKVKDLKTDDSNLPKRAVIVVASKKPQDGDLVLAYNSDNKFILRNYRLIKDKEILVSSVQEFQGKNVDLSLKKFRIYGKVIYFQEYHV